MEPGETIGAEWYGNRYRARGSEVGSREKETQSVSLSHP